MKRVKISASTSYEVLVGSDLIPQTGRCVAQMNASSTAAVISDSNVWPIYGETVCQSLHEYGINTVHFVFPAGESSKNASTYLEILNFLAENKITRSDLLIALGGGVVGDITGFAAATYLRGILYMQIPTSLLAMVDSSVGGKTAIDLPAGKNLVGAFKQPCIVLCDTLALRTLPTEIFRDGCAEIIKYGVLFDADLVSYLNSTGLDFDREQVIAKCVAYKADIVAEDELDKGLRQKLNLGHTIAHGIEAGSNFQITHGQAVAAGMAIITKAAAAHGICSQQTYQTVTTLLDRFQLPISTDFSAEQLFRSALSDKKRSGATVNLIVPKQIGLCEILPVPVNQLQSFIKVGL